MSEVHKLLIDEHASNAAGIFSESALDDGVDGITDEILSAFCVGHRNGIKLSNVDLRKGNESHWLWLGDALLAVVTLGKVSLVVSTSSASSTTVVHSSVVALMVGVTLLISTLVVSTIVVSTLVAVAALVLVRDTH